MDRRATSAAASMAALAAAAAAGEGADGAARAVMTTTTRVDDRDVKPPTNNPGGAVVSGGSSSLSPAAVVTVVSTSRTTGAGAVAAGGGGGGPSCKAERCGADLTDARRYHRRHKVCEAHAKAPVVIVAGLRQRFCQQCSRFHELSEFDDVKKSCRKRLAGHNERRRKSSAADGWRHDDPRPENGRGHHPAAPGNNPPAQMNNLQIR